MLEKAADDTVVWRSFLKRSTKDNSLKGFEKLQMVSNILTEAVGSNLTDEVCLEDP